MADEMAERNIERVRELYGKFSHIDPDEMALFFTEDAYIQPMMKDPYSGRDEIRRMCGIWASHWSGIEMPLRNVVGSGNVVMTEWSDESTFEGKPYVIPCAGVFEFDGDKIKAWRLYYDYAAEPQAATGLHGRRS